MAGFTISSVEFDKSLVSNREELTCTVNIKNTSGKGLKTYGVTIRLFAKTGDGSDRKLINFNTSEGSMDTTLWASNATKTFVASSGAIDTSDLDLSNREVKPSTTNGAFYIDVYGNTTGSPSTRTYSSTQTVSTFEDLGVTIIGDRIAVRCAEFSAERCDENGVLDDEGENVLIRAKVTSDHTVDEMTANGYPTTATVMISDDPNAFVDEVPSTDTTLYSMSTLLAGVYEYTLDASGSATPSTSPTALTITIPKNKTWFIRVLFNDKYDPCLCMMSVGRSFSNVHLSGKSTGGVCFGGFSTSEENNPKFECYYPAYFKAGIAEGAAPIDAGTIAAVGNTSSGSYKDIPVEFNRTFTTPPVVVCGFQTASTAGTFGRCTCAATNVTETGFTLRFFNGDSAGRNPNFTWIAFGT